MQPSKYEKGERFPFPIKLIWTPTCWFGKQNSHAKLKPCKLGFCMQRK